MEKHYVDQNGNYGTALNGPIPSGSIEVPERPDPKMAWDGNKWIWNLEDFKKSVNLRTNIALQEIKSGYPELETQTWDQQEKEARAYLLDSGAHTPMLDAICLHSGESKGSLAVYIVQKADTFAARAGRILGVKRSLNALLELEPDPSVLDLDTPFLDPEE